MSTFDETGAARVVKNLLADLAAAAANEPDPQQQAILFAVHAWVSDEGRPAALEAIARAHRTCANASPTSAPATWS